ncbi:MAG: hypothetical protein M1825_006418 [Sarcosagium campestre]|nr:MAG: hypothetical protein M1825_006418 [Sarcosagium campestre]
MTEHEHGLGASGLRRIRQHPALPGPSLSLSNSSDQKTLAPPLSAGLNVSLPSSRMPSSTSMGPASPMLNISEDLSRFPSESLHSFSFAQHSDDHLHGRQNVVKRSIDFFRDRLGWAASNPGIAHAQAKLSGDYEAQSMMELLSRASLSGKDGVPAQGLALLRGPLTGPAQMEGDNLFEKSFFPSADGKGSSTILAGADSLETPAEIAEDDGDIDEGIQESPKSTPKPFKSVEASPELTQSFNSSRRRTSLKRTYTDLSPLTLQTKLVEALNQPYVAREGIMGVQTMSPGTIPGTPHLPHSSLTPYSAAVHGHTSRWAPAAQAIFTTETTAPWTIVAANDLACLVFGVKKAELRKIGILEVVREERRAWLEQKLKMPVPDASTESSSISNEERKPTPKNSLSPSLGQGVTAQLLSKPAWRDRRSKTSDAGASGESTKPTADKSASSTGRASRGVLLCGDVVPIQKRNGAVGSASLWVKEKHNSLIWVVEEIVEDKSTLQLGTDGSVLAYSGATSSIWGPEKVTRGVDIGLLIPHIPRRRTGDASVDYEEVEKTVHYTIRNSDGVHVPATLGTSAEAASLQVSSFPHIAGIVVVSATTSRIISSNSVFTSSLFGHTPPNGSHISELIPGFDDILRILTEEENLRLVDGTVVPEQNFRRARAILSLREGNADAASLFRPVGLAAKHRDGSEIRIEVQMRVVKSDRMPANVEESVIDEASELTEYEDGMDVVLTGASSEMVYALWITYSRHLHAAGRPGTRASPLLSRPGTPPHQPSPGQTQRNIVATPDETEHDEARIEAPQYSHLSAQIKEAAEQPISEGAVQDAVTRGSDGVPERNSKLSTIAKLEKKTIDDFAVLEEMGKGAYGEVKLARYKREISRKVVLKYVIKRRILVDTWTRDRRLGTVPLEIHVLDYLRRDGLRHPNIVEMIDFFEDDANYYIEMIPHGLPGMDLFDYIELRVNMDEAECKSVFRQVAAAIHHLHTKAAVVHRDIKDENVVLDGEGNIKLIDFGSAAYIKNGPFDVFVGTIDYAAPEVLAGKSYRGREQDVWALGILLYTIVYKENPFYSVDEIMDHDLRVPYIMSDANIDLIRLMLNRDVERRLTIDEVLEHAWCRVDLEEDDSPVDM